MSPRADWVLTSLISGIFAQQLFRSHEPQADLSVAFALLRRCALAFVLSHLDSAHPFIDAFILFSTCVGSLVVSILVYRTSIFHPLSKFPGPLAAKASRLWIAKITAKKKTHLK